MTEKEFLDKFQNESTAHWSREAARRGLALAKEAGAVFDPEPVELPPLTAWPIPGNDAYGKAVAGPDGEALTMAQAREVVRRCNAWQELQQRAKRSTPWGEIERQKFLELLR